MPGSARASLRRGMNLGNALDAPREGDWGVVLQSSDFSLAKQAGFDHVRLPARFSAHAGYATPYAVDAAFFARVDWAIDQALGQGLSIIIDVHHYKEMMSAPDEERPRFLAIWKQIAERYRDRPQRVVFELLNEPCDRLTADLWNEILPQVLQVIRGSNPTRTVIVEGVHWASAHNLRFTLKLPDDSDLVGSFHMYQPILFTHQGASFMPAEYQTRGVIFPGPPAQPLIPLPQASAIDWVRLWFERYDEQPADRNPSGPATIAEELDLAQAFAEVRHLPVYMGEFACIDAADAKSRAAWTKMVRTEAERRGFGWAYWDDGGHFKAHDRTTGDWVPGLPAALFE